MADSITTSNGCPIDNNQNSLTAGPGGAILLQDFTLIDKLASFDRERTPERVVHAKGSGAHGEFEVFEDMSKYTRANFLNKAGKKTPMFARFSTVGGEKGSSDCARDPRGFAVKFYTEEGNYDIVGNNTPVFFINDPMKFPDFIHTQKRCPVRNIGDVDAAFGFWQHNPETLHQLTILFSDRGTPYGYRHMNGYGSHTFRWVNAEGAVHYVKYHFKTNQGIKNFTAAEAGAMTVANPDFAQTDLYEHIAKKDFPGWTLYVQLMPEKEADAYEWDIFDVTKVWPHKDYPLRKVGRMTLNRNPVNYHAEVEQSAFSPSHFVPGIEASADSMLQARLFSYPDTHRHRLGANYTQIPVNCPYRARLNNGLRDGPYCYNGNGGSAVNHEPSFESRTYAEPSWAPSAPAVSGVTQRNNGHLPHNNSHYAQAAGLWHVFSAKEKAHLIANLSAPLSQVRKDIRAKILAMFHKVDKDYGSRLEAAVNKHLPKAQQPKYTLEYFALHGRALRIRVVLEYLGVNYEDKHVSFQEFGENKAAGKYTFGQLPMLQLPCGTKLSQTASICRYLGEALRGPAGEVLYPGLSNPDMAFEIDALLDDAAAFAAPTAKFLVPMHPEYKDRDVHFAAFLVKTWPQWLAKLEAKITEHGGSFLLGKKLTLADLIVASDFFATSHSESFENSHILESVLDQYPKVKSWINDLHKQFASFLKAQDRAFATPVKTAPRQSDAFTRIVKLTVKPGRLEEFQKMISTACTESRKEPGCLRWDLMRDRANKCVFHLYEVYADKANAFTAHTKTDHCKAFLAFKASGGFEGNPEASAPESVDLQGFEKPVKHAVCIMNPDGGSGVNGLVKLTHVEGEKCKIHARITGLAPGQHGFHIHQFGNLIEGCKTAGPHFNPGKRTHGGPKDSEADRHFGDLGNVTAGEDGVADMEIEDSLVSLWGETKVFGRSFVVHAGVDDLGKGGHALSSTTGNAGGRLACGVIGISGKF